MLFKQSTNRNHVIKMVQDDDRVTGLASLTLTITASKDGAAFGSISPTVTDLGSGYYNLALTTSHTDTLGGLVLKITGTGAVMGSPEIHQVVVDLPGAAGALAAYVSTLPTKTGAIVADGSNAAGTFKTNLASTVDDAYKDAMVKFTSGTLVEQVKKVTGYNGTTKFLTVNAFTTAPSAADTFEIVND